MNQSLVRRGLLLLAAACPETPIEALAELSLGQRDARLLTLREWTFGPQVVSVATCPACDCRLELAFEVGDVRLAGLPEPAGILSVELAGYEVSFRPPNSLDLDSCRGLEAPAQAGRLLLERCLLAIHRQGETIDLDRLPADLIDGIIVQMVQADPQADIRLDLTCPSCQHHWQVIFDIVSFFWRELCTWADRTLAEVHLLASAYSWREADILALSPSRRRIYLGMIGGGRG